MGSINDIWQPHIKNTRTRGSHETIDFWMYRPKEESKPSIKCGICKQDITGHQHCPSCYPDKPKEERDWSSFNVIVRTDPFRETGDIPNPKGDDWG